MQVKAFVLARTALDHGDGTFDAEGLALSRASFSQFPATTAVPAILVLEAPYEELPAAAHVGVRVSTPTHDPEEDGWSEEVRLTRSHSGGRSVPAVFVRTVLLNMTLPEPGIYSIDLRVNGRQEASCIFIATEEVMEEEAARTAAER